MSFLKSIFGGSKETPTPSSNTKSSSSNPTSNKELPEWYTNFLTVEAFESLPPVLQRPSQDEWIGFMSDADILAKPLVPPSSASLTLFAKITDENTSPKEAAQMAAEDPILAARVLKSVNSAYYGLPNPISDVHTAVNLMGLEQLKILVMSQVVESNTRPGHDLESIAVHSAIVGQIAGFIAMQHGLNRSTLTTLGVLHDMGRLLSPFIEGKQNPKFLELNVELQHGLLGGAFSRIWKLPQSLISTLENLPFATVGHNDDVHSNQDKAIDVLALAQFLANAFGFVDGSTINFPKESVKKLNMNEDPKKWLKESQIHEIHKTSLLF